MIPALQIAIQSLYDTFSRYPDRSTTDGCPCCVSESDKQKLHAKSLRALQADDISRYAFKAMTTWGEVEDFQHFLPRIFELIATTGLSCDACVVLGKLDYAQWHTWEQTEKAAVKSFLLAWWADSIAGQYIDVQEFVKISLLIGAIDPLLDRWIPAFEDQRFRNLVQFINGSYYDLLGAQSSFKELDAASIHKLLQWLQSKKEVLEAAFYHFEPIDPTFAKDISNALHILEWTPWPA